MQKTTPNALAEQFAGWDRLTDAARRGLHHAAEETRKTGEDWASTEHLLLGLLREDGTGAGRLLERLGLSREAVRREVAHYRVGMAYLPRVRLTPRALRVIDLAVAEARRLDAGAVGTEHLILGLIAEGEGLAARVLEKLGIDLDQARAEAAVLLRDAAAGA